jgi:hypothetical protein
MDAPLIKPWTVSLTAATLFTISKLPRLKLSVPSELIVMEFVVPNKGVLVTLQLETPRYVPIEEEIPEKRVFID